MQAGFDDALLDNFDMLHTLSRRLCNTSYDAEDLVQETCLSAWQAWAKNGAPDDARAWFATICLNHARSRWRRRAVRPPEHLVADVELDVLARPLPGDGVETQTIANTEARLIRQHLALLPYEQREAICLMNLYGFTAARSARILGSHATPFCRESTAATEPLPRC